MRDHFGNNMLSSNLEFAKGIKILDDCEGTCNWIVSGTDANKTVTYETVAAWSGTNGLQLFTGDADSEEFDQVTAKKYVDKSETGLLVYRAKIGVPDISKVYTISLGLRLRTGSKSYLFLLGYFPNTPNALYITTGPSYVEVDGSDFAIVDNMWGTMELVVDCLAKQYISCNIFGHEVSLAGIDSYDEGANTGELIEFYLSVGCTAEAPATLYADNIYLGEYVNV